MKFIFVLGSKFNEGVQSNDVKQSNNIDIVFVKKKKKTLLTLLVKLCLVGNCTIFFLNKELLIYVMVLNLTYLVQFPKKKTYLVQSSKVDP